MSDSPDLELATIDQILSELQKRPIAFMLVVVEQTNYDHAGRLAFSGCKDDGLTILEKAYKFLDRQEDQWQNVY